MSEKQFRLSKKKKCWAKTFKSTAVTRGTALNYPVGVQTQYTRDVQKILNAVIREAVKGVRAAFDTPQAKEYYAEDAATPSFTKAVNTSLDKLFERLSTKSAIEANKIARRMVDVTNKSSQSGMGASLKELSGGVTLKPSEMGGQIAEVLQASIESNVSLIVDITDSYLAKVTDAVNRSIQNGRGLADLIPFMRKQTGVTKRHGKNVALDQTRKAYNSLNKARMENVGLSKFEWLHSGGSQRPRKFHKTRWPEGLNGGIFDIHDPPVIDQDTGERGLPAQLYYCHCRMIPVLVFDEGVLEE